jgi:type IV pilus assembly protein PilC
MLFQAGITPVEAMSLLLSDTKSQEGKSVIQDIYNTCAQGDTFFHAVEASGVFPEYVLHMISLGESSGNLDTVMQSLADYYSREEEISDSIKEAIRYPFIMILMMFVVIIVLVTKVMPIFQQVFLQLGSDMNGMAISLLNLGTKINHYSIVLLCLLMILVLFYLWGAHTASGKKMTSSFWHNFSFTKNFYENVSAERFASGMALALSSGLDTFQSLDLAVQLIDDSKFQYKIRGCKEAVEQGASLTDALSDAAIFSNFHLRMINIGWKTGSADAVFRKIADDYDRETTKRLQFMLSVIEPTLVIVLSLIIGLILLSVILPLLGIMSSIG